MGDIKFNPQLLEAFKANLQNKIGPLGQRAPLEETEEEKMKRLKQQALQRMMQMRSQDDKTEY